MGLGLGVGNVFIALFLLPKTSAAPKAHVLNSPSLTLLLLHTMSLFLRLSIITFPSAPLLFSFLYIYQFFDFQLVTTQICVVFLSISCFLALVSIFFSGYVVITVVWWLPFAELEEFTIVNIFSQQQREEERTLEQKSECLRFLAECLPIEKRWLHAPPCSFFFPQSFCQGERTHLKGPFSRFSLVFILLKRNCCWV